MSEAYVVAVNGLSALRSVEEIPENIRTAALQAVNRTLDRSKAASARRMREQVAFPARYLSGQDGRLAVTKRARKDDLEGTITGRFRPTSLARFSTGGAVRKAGVTVEVAPGFARFMRQAFLIRLRAGTADIDTRSNLGLAIRLKPGERIANKTRMVPLRGNLYLLYGPSVSHVFESVAAEEAEPAAEFLEQEFSRLLELRL